MNEMCRPDSGSATTGRAVRVSQSDGSSAPYPSESAAVCSRL